MVVTDEAQKQVTLTTLASGRAILFPYAEGLTGKKFTAEARCVEGHAQTTVALDDDGDGTAEMKLRRAAPQRRAVSRRRVHSRHDGVDEQKKSRA